MAFFKMLFMILNKILILKRVCNYKVTSKNLNIIVDIDLF